MKTAAKVIRNLENAGFEAYIVGGAVRDYLLGKVPHDMDVASNAYPEEVKKLFNRTVDIGIEHGTVLVLMEGEGIEVTTFRTESEYTDLRRPDKVEFVQSLEEDLKRRDFTINAMAMDKDLAIIDPFGGKSDLEKCLIRAVGEAGERFQEDALRMLRAVRFSGQLNFAIEEGTLAAIRSHASLIRSVAVERLKNELDKILLNPRTQHSMAYLKDSGLAKHLPAGGLLSMDWTGYEPKGQAAFGWAYLLHSQQKQFEEIKGYKFSNAERRLVERALEAANLTEWDDWTFYCFEAKELEIACYLNGTDMDIPLRKEQLPIKSKRELAVNGIDLMEWSGRKQGPWLRQWIEKMERHIVYGQLENDNGLIKDWFLNEYNGDS
ncbi:CCA tRNA nucleotidyltransferase [Planococcus sp. APC 3906]|uniref:CCA tRNA nucleotidyltransferase n=1 Tax=Planococcus sp. APC 3906 TaxID=3035194 RepID=UPI0025B2D903|nr:CCA tRNA nucleotidyltransferase [Planococcus sp. APC 3906]MDN3450898.1 CCA tRNA nucleotidyltransferase [Planococcus sp. APC 3906]